MYNYEQYVSLDEVDSLVQVNLLKPELQESLVDQAKEALFIIRAYPDTPLTDLQPVLSQISQSHLRFISKLSEEASADQVLDLFELNLILTTYPASDPLPEFSLK